MRWSPSGSASLMVAMMFDNGNCFTGRFDDVRRTIGEEIAAFAPLGRSFNGLLEAMSRFGDAAVEAARGELRRRLKALHRSGRRRRDLVLAVDSSKLMLPATTSNEEAFGIADNGTTPQALLTAVVDMDTGMPWDWRVVKARGCERRNLLAMVPQLPQDAILLADRLFVGHALWHALNRQRVKFVVRVGSNVRLIRDLLPESDVKVDRRSGMVYSWPKDLRRTSPPLKLRLITIKIAGGRMWLLTNVLDRAILSDDAAARLYKRRWGVEIAFRTLKQVMGFERLKCHSGSRAAVEANWMMIALGLLSVLAKGAMPKRDEDQWRFSPAKGLRILRSAVLGVVRDSADGLLARLANARERKYKRRSGKAARTRRRTRTTPERDSGKPPRINKATKALRLQAANWKPPPCE